VPIDEAHSRQPINPYGRSKFMVEEMLKDLAHSDGLRYAILRYFNAAGADSKARVGERHEPESHLIPLVLQVASGKRKHITVYGQDYPTPDGTCVRDYIHVTDLCAAHLAALQQLMNDKANIICNLGTSHGYSVQQVIDVARQVTGRDIVVVIGERRAGDPAVLVADASAANSRLNWQAQHSSLEMIIKDAWQFVQR
jgi:UDP-glucose 4-epimerase